MCWSIEFKHIQKFRELSILFIMWYKNFEKDAPNSFIYSKEVPGHILELLRFPSPSCSLQVWACRHNSAYLYLFWTELGSPSFESRDSQLSSSCSKVLGNEETVVSQRREILWNFRPDPFLNWFMHPIDIAIVIKIRLVHSLNMKKIHWKQIHWYLVCC